MLSELGKKYLCDKVDEWHTFKGKTYFDVYESYLEKFRARDITFLELGVRDGASLQVWKEYFSSNTKIIGIDIDLRCKRFEGGNISIEVGSQGDEDFLHSVIKRHGPFDVILDDASHINELTLKSFNQLSKYISPGGLYIIEDLRNSYEDLTEDVKKWPGMHLNEGNLNYNNLLTRRYLNDTILSIIREFDYRCGDFEAVHFHSQMVILQK
jgi:hypothetical protein